MKPFNAIARWYRKEGMIQFMFGNMWNDSDSRMVGGRATLVFLWLVLILSATPLMQYYFFQK